jgi:hypothetical protein
LSSALYIMYESTTEQQKYIWSEQGHMKCKEPIFLKTQNQNT